MYLAKEIDIIQDLAAKAADLTISLQPGIKTWNKPDSQGPVSTADIAIDKFLVKQIKINFPDDLIVSEESYTEFPKQAQKRVWFIDPIDGTKSYIAGKHDYVVMIGLVKNNKPILGVIARPAQRSIFVGTVGARPEDTQAWVKTHENIKKLQLSNQETSYSNLRVVGSPFSRSKKNSQLLKILQTNNLDLKSSVGYKATMIANNQADLYVAWTHRLNLWDTCAPAALVRAAGGYIMTMDSKELNFSQNIKHEKPIIMSSFKINKDLRDQIQKISQR